MLRNNLTDLVNNIVALAQLDVDTELDKQEQEKELREIILDLYMDGIKHGMLFGEMKEKMLIVRQEITNEQ